MMCKIALPPKIELDDLNLRFTAIKEIFLGQYESSNFKFVSDYSAKLLSDFGRFNQVLLTLLQIQKAYVASENVGVTITS